MKEKRRLGRPPKSKSTDRHGAILEAALDLFSSHGYEATSIRMIAKKVGVSDPALYSHFKSKSEILKTLFEIHGPKALYSATERFDLELASRKPKEFAHGALNLLAERWFSPSENKFFRLLLIENLTGTIDKSMRISNLQAPMKQKLSQLALWLIDNGRAIKVDPQWMVSQFIDPIVAIRTEVAITPENQSLEHTQNLLSEHFENFAAVFLPNL